MRFEGFSFGSTGVESAQAWQQSYPFGGKRRSLQVGQIAGGHNFGERQLRNPNRRDSDQTSRVNCRRSGSGTSRLS